MKCGRWGRTALTLLGTLLPACGSTEGPPVQWEGPTAEGAVVTAFTTRIPGDTPERQAIALTQTVYAATRVENAVGAIIVSPQDERVAFTAMHRITHMPVNAPLLYLDEQGQLSEATLREMRRLRPDGVVEDGTVQVYVVGDVDHRVATTIREELGYEVRELLAPNPVKLAELLDRWQAALKTDHPDEVVISAVDHPDGVAQGIGAMSWNAHMGRGLPGRTVTTFPRKPDSFWSGVSVKPTCA